MKWINLHLFALPLMAILLLGSAPLVRATVWQDAPGYGRINDDKDKDKDKEKRKKKVPEGSTGAILVLAAGVLGGGLLVWKRKKRTAAA